MVTHTATGQADLVQADALTFTRFGGLAALLAGASGFLYAVAFLALRHALLSALCLLLIGVSASAALVALHGRVREAEPGYALWALLLGTIGTLGTALHGGYDLANVLNPPAMPNLDLPSQVDPRGLLTFGVTGLTLVVFSWLIVRSRRLPAGLGYLGYVAASLLLLLYLGRLIVLDATSPLIVIPALLSGFLVNPAWYLWLGLTLWREGEPG